jgi:uncharacterized membrane protein
MRGSWLLPLLLASCVLQESDHGQFCETDEDCPAETTCQVNARFSGRSCQPLFTFANPDLGEAFYCDGAKPVLDAYCIRCHGATPANGAPPTFRLDVYASTGGIDGAQAKASRVASRAGVTRDMPPPGETPQPSDAERTTLRAWAASGAKECP